MKLDEKLKKEFFNDHLPYKITQLKTHRFYKEEFKEMLNASYLHRKYEICAIEISFIAGRLFLDFLGIGIDKKSKKLKGNRRLKEDDICVEDLGGKFVDIDSISEKDKRVLEIFYNRGNKGAAHLTWEKREIDGWEFLDEGVKLIVELLNDNLYKIVNQQMREK